MRKAPAWKPIPFKGKQQITFTIFETWRAVNYDSKVRLNRRANVAEAFDAAQVLRRGSACDNFGILGRHP
jgi:hypothetical protein